MNNNEGDRVRDLIQHAVAGLDPTDRAERIAYCRAHKEHGVRAHISDEDDLIEFVWGGRRLAMARVDDLFGDEPLVAEFIAAEVPDHVPDDL